MRSATVRAARRRGWVWPIAPRTPRPSSRQIFGSWVVLPEPVSPATTTTWCSAIASRRSSRRALTGSSGGRTPPGPPRGGERSAPARSRSPPRRALARGDPPRAAGGPRAGASRCASRSVSSSRRVRRISSVAATAIDASGRTFQFAAIEHGAGPCADAIRSLEDRPSAPRSLGATEAPAGTAGGGVHPAAQDGLADLGADDRPRARRHARGEPPAAERRRGGRLRDPQRRRCR